MSYPEALHRRLVTEVEDVIERTKSLPGSWYADPEIAAFEKTHVIRRTWQPIGPISMDLQSIKDRPPPSVKRNARRRRLEQDRASSPHPSSVGDENEERESVPNPADLFSELAAHHADSHQIKGDPGGEPPNP